MLELTNVRVRSFDILSLDIFWDEIPHFDDALNYSFTVLRSDNETSGYAPVSEPIIGRNHFKDTSISPRKSQYHRIYYRVLVTHRVSGETATFPDVGGVCLAARPNLYALEAARQERLRLREVDGRELLILKKRRTGQRCSVCYDRVLKRRLRSGCTTCFDTGFVGGFYPPILVYGQVTSTEDSTHKGKGGNTEIQNSGLRIANFPELDEGDLIIETENIRWRVGTVIRKIRLQRAVVKQQCPLHRIPNTDIEYKIPVNLDIDTLAQLEGSPHWGYTNFMSIDSHNLHTALHEKGGGER